MLTIAFVTFHLWSLCACSIWGCYISIHVCISCDHLIIQTSKMCLNLVAFRRIMAKFEDVWCYQLLLQSAFSRKRVITFYFSRIMRNPSDSRGSLTIKYLYDLLSDEPPDLLVIDNRLKREKTIAHEQCCSLLPKTLESIFTSVNFGKKLFYCYICAIFVKVWFRRHADSWPYIISRDSCCSRGARRSSRARGTSFSTWPHWPH